MKRQAPTNRIVHNAAAKSAEIFIYDEIGPSDWGYVGAKGFAEAIRNIGEVDQIDVRINSPGGSLWEASAIYTILAKHAANVVIHIDGIAFSAASYIAMAGDEINMAENAMMMIHLPIGAVYGNADDLRKEALILEQWESSITNVYAARTKIDAKTIYDMLAAETWLTAPQAKEKGFATSVVPNKAVSARVDLSKFKNVPDWAKASAILNSTKEPIVPDPVITPEMKAAAEAKAAADAKAAVEAKATADAKLAADAKAAADKVVADKAAADIAAKLNGGGNVTMTAAELQTMIDRTVAAARLRDSEIDAVCQRCGVPQMAAGFKADPKMQIADVKERMIDVLCSKNVPVGGAVGADPSTGASPEAKYKAEYAQHKDIFTGNGVNEEQYVSMRKAEDGL